MPHGRDNDWIVSDASWWNPVAEAGSLLRLGADLVASIEITEVPTTTLSGLPYASFQSGDDFTLERIRGEVIVTLDPEEVAATWFGVLDMRIEVMDLDPVSGQVVFPPNWNGMSAVTANRSFLWQHSHIFRRLGSWLEPSQADSSNITIPVDVKARRRVLNSHGVVLLVQWSTLTGTGNLPFLNMLTRLRALGSKPA